MRLVIAGSRSTPHRDAVAQVRAAYNSYLKLFPAPTTIIHGDAKGIDAAAKSIFTSRLEVVPFPANWDLYGKYAAEIRNKEMASVGDVLLVIAGDNSRGMRSIIKEMRERRKPVLVTEPSREGRIWLSYGISPSAICGYNNWKVGDILDRQGDLFRITKIDDSDVWGYRSNLGTDDFGSEICWLPIDWSCTCITSLVGEG